MKTLFVKKCITTKGTENIIMKKIHSCGVVVPRKSLKKLVEMAMDKGCVKFSISEKGKIFV